MGKLIARLIDAGMPRKIALHMFHEYKRFGRLKDFERYVEEVEAESREPMARV